MGFSNDNLKGFVLAPLLSGFIGASFIIKKKGLRKAAAASGVRAGVGGYSYLLEPLWWLGMITMIIGEVANFVAYAFAPAVLVTPFGALSIIVSAVLAHFILKEKLHPLGILGCIMCIMGSVVIVIHAPKERPITSVQEIWSMAIQPVTCDPHNELNRGSFPRRFVFGASSSAYQYEDAFNEGGKGPHIWDTFTEKNPDAVDDGSSGKIAADSYHRYKEDVEAIKFMGLDACRLHIEWSRILPSGKSNGGRGVNPEGIEHYRKLIHVLKDNSL